MQPATRAGFPGFRPVLVTGLLGLLAACAPSRPPITGPAGPASPVPPAGESTESSRRIDWRLVYLIHGDGDYTYHDAAGNRLKADEEAFSQAVEVAERATRAEVFIFHQRAAGTRMFGSVSGGTLSHYRFGKLLHRQPYSTDSDPRDLSVETGLFKAYADDYAQPLRILAYFGHEIPRLDGPGYSASRPERDFSIARFAQGLSLWTRSTDGSEKPFDLIILSTCYGGSPQMMTALTPLTRYAVASPAYLHLSFLDLRALANFEADSAAPPAGDALHRLADTVAAQSFERLKAHTQTEITVAAYDLEQTGPFLESRTARTGPSAGDSYWRDCAAKRGFDSAQASRGVTLHYRAPRFGPGKGIASRSGWECPD